jgi:hypothetical protein
MTGLRLKAERYEAKAVRLRRKVVHMAKASGDSHRDIAEQERLARRQERNSRAHRRSIALTKLERLRKLEFEGPESEGSAYSVGSVGSYPDSVRDTDDLEEEVESREMNGKNWLWYMQNGM